MGDPNSIEQVDCPCTRIYNDGTAVDGCPECDGLGTIEVESLDSRAAEVEQYEHWHDGQLGVDQFCMACDAERAA